MNGLEREEATVNGLERSARSISTTSNRWPVVSLVCGVAPIILLLLYHPLIVDALRQFFPDNVRGASINFLAVPILLTALAVGAGIAAVRRADRLPARRARFAPAVLALTLGIFDSGLLVVVWLPTVTAIHS